jgi:hypothetical protein
VSEKRAELVIAEQVRLQSVIRLAMADLVDKIEATRLSSGLTWQEALAVVRNVGGFPPALQQGLARLYENKLVRESMDEEWRDPNAVP